MCTSGKVKDSLFVTVIVKKNLVTHILIERFVILQRSENFIEMPTRKLFM